MTSKVIRSSVEFYSFTFARFAGYFVFPKKNLPVRES